MLLVSFLYKKGKGVKRRGEALKENEAGESS
jgi:hypothetical protein